MNNDNEHVAKPVVQTLDTGVAAPIPINTEDAINLARKQQEYQENLESLEQNGTLAKQNAPQEHIAKAISANSAEGVKLDAKQFHQTNDIVKVVEQKTSPKTYIIMIAVLIVIAIIIAIEVKHYIL